MWFTRWLLVVYRVFVCRQFQSDLKGVSNMEALSGVKVLDLSDEIAGSYCAKLMADFGADVIKIEEPGGNKMRKAGPFLDDDPHPEKSGRFFYLNTNKKSVTLNLKTKTGVELFKKLAGDADVVIENFNPGVMAERGISYEVLSDLNPGLVLLSITWFGQDGPYRDYKATNLIAEGLGGSMFTARHTRWPKGRPAVLGGAQAEYRCGLLANIAVSAALLSQADSHKGTWIDISVAESVVSSLTGMTADYTYMGFSRTTVPWAVHGFPTQENYRCKDGWVNILTGIGGTAKVATLIEKPELKDNPYFAKAGARIAEPEKFEELCIPWFKEHDKWEIAKKAQKLKLAFSPTLSPVELLEDEQLKAREAFVTVEHPVMGEVTYFGAPAKMSESPCKAGRSPLIGEHNEMVYGGLGYPKEECVRLRERGII